MAEKQHPITALLLASRPISWINTAYPFAAAYLVTTRSFDVTFWIGTLFFLVPYNMAMYGINDVFDYESDIKNPRKGGSHGAVLQPTTHRLTLWAAALSCLPFLVYLLWVGNLASGLVLLASMFFVVFYSAPPLRLKEVPFADSLTSATHFYSPAVYGLVLAGAHWDWSLVAIILAFASWGVASQSFGSVQDIMVDREAGIASIGTFLGAKRTVRFSLVCYLLAGVIMLTTHWPGPVAAVIALPYVAMVWPYRNDPDEDCAKSTTGWKRFLWLNQLSGFIVTLLLIWYVW